MDQSKKTMRHFYCRDVLWETFEQMANDFDCSIDYLINEAMRYYARSKNYQSAQATGGDFRGESGGGAAARPPRSEAPRDARDSGRETRDAREMRDPRDSFASPPGGGGGGGGPHIRRNNPPPPPRQGSP